MKLVQLLAALVLGLALLTILADTIVTATTREWFARDMTLRAQLAVQGVKRTIVTAADEGRFDIVGERLEDIAHDTRILAAFACSRSDELVARTEDLPKGLGCEGASLVGDRDGGLMNLPEGEVHLAYVP